MMDFSAALAAAKTGAKVRRVSWEQAEWLVGAYMRVTVLTDPDGESLEAMVMVYPDGTIRLFADSQWDLLAEDWVLVQ